MITITAASGRFGRLVVDELLRRGIPPIELVATSRDASKLADLASRGVTVREADYSDPESLAAAFADLDRLLLVSSGEFGRQFEQHSNVIQAAKNANASALIYTSYLNADTSGIIMARDHARTEELIRTSGIPFAILRNGSYIENYTDNIDMWLQYGTIIGSAGDGKISGATRADLALAAAAVAADEAVINRVYELGGSRFTMAGLAAETSSQTGTVVSYTDMSATKYANTLASAGVPQFLADAIADNSVGAARGGWHTDSKELETLLGRPSTPIADAVAEALKNRQV